MLYMLPPFPDNIPVQALATVDFQLVANGDQHETDVLWKAATEFGFWYLKNHGADKGIESMFAVGAETIALPLQEKLRYVQADTGPALSFGYKAAGASAVDASGALDSIEEINIARDDVLAWPEEVHRAYPAPVHQHMLSAVAPFVLAADKVNHTLLGALGTKLGLPSGTLVELHASENPSGSEVRCIRRAPRDGDVVALGEHTDFGSLSFLHNRLGGLQVLVPGDDEWKYIKPVPGLAICNVGDALAILSGGILRSALHRVAPPPGLQSKYERWSLVYFSRPGNTVPLRALADKSALIAKATQHYGSRYTDTGETAGEWFARRISNRRVKNRTGPETWNASIGTEHSVIGGSRM